MAAVVSFLFCVILGPWIIKWLAKINVGQYVRKEHVSSLYKLHKHKEGTPTMGGILIIVSVLLSSLLWCRLDNDYVILVLAGMVWLGVIGFIDDLIKVQEKSARGVRAIAKLTGQILLALIIGIFVIKNENLGTGLFI